jgi:hypothetical protein
MESIDNQNTNNTISDCTEIDNYYDNLSDNVNNDNVNNDNVNNDQNSLIKHVMNILVSEQSDHMLDRTKCSTTSRIIYDYLTNGSIGANNNLCNISPNFHLLSNEIIQNQLSNFVYYVHFKHFTNDTSHYFIIFQNQTNLTILQSAVFEYSLMDWCFPEQSITKLKREYYFDQSNSNQLHNNNKNQEWKIREDYAFTCFVKNCNILLAIQNNQFSGGQVEPIQSFQTKFLYQLMKLQGNWNRHNLSEKIHLYHILFGCKLDYNRLQIIVQQNTDNHAEIKYFSSQFTL